MPLCYHYGKLQTPKYNFYINLQFLIKNSASFQGTRWSSDGFLTHTHTYVHMHARKLHISMKGIPCRLLLLLPEQGHRGADKSLTRPGRKQANVSVRMAWISFGALPCKKNNLMTARVSMLLISRASLTCFLVGLRTYQHPGNSNNENGMFNKTDKAVMD